MIIILFSLSLSGSLVPAAENIAHSFQHLFPVEQGGDSQRSSLPQQVRPEDCEAAR